MSNPAEAAARDEAERLGRIVGSEVDVIDDALLSEHVEQARHLTDLHAALEDTGGTGAWLYGEGRAV